MYLDKYFDAVDGLFSRIRSSQYDTIGRAGVIVASSLAQKGVVHIMDTGHLLSHEAFKRAGGLLALTPFSFEMVVDNPVERRPAGPAASEKEAHMARTVAVALDSSRVAFGDVMLLNSNSGRTSNVIETALQCNERGLCTIGIASREQMERCEAVHPSGKKLADACDIFIDNCGPYGDAMVEVRDNERMAPSSGLGAAFILWAIQAVAVENLQSRGLNPSIYRSVHLGGEGYMKEQHDRYLEQGY